MPQISATAGFDFLIVIPTIIMFMLLACWLVSKLFFED